MNVNGMPFVECPDPPLPIRTQSVFVVATGRQANCEHLRDGAPQHSATDRVGLVLPGGSRRFQGAPETTAREPEAAEGVWSTR